MGPPQQHEFGHDQAELGDISLPLRPLGWRSADESFCTAFRRCWSLHAAPSARGVQTRPSRNCSLDLRGYNLSSKPEKVEDGGPWHAATDIRALIAQLGYQSFVLVGHDWGGAATSWSFALHLIRSYWTGWSSPGDPAPGHLRPCPA